MNQSKIESKETILLVNCQNLLSTQLSWVIIERQTNLLFSFSFTFFVQIKLIQICIFEYLITTLFFIQPLKKYSILLIIQKLHKFIKMYSNKYLTIDPLILETLNLNEKRMNHILDILHGNPTKKAIRKNHDNLKNVNKTQLVVDKKTSLPSILKLKQNNEENSKQTRNKSLIFNKQRNKSIQTIQSPENEILNKQQKNKINFHKRLPISAKNSLATMEKQMSNQIMLDNKLLKKNQLISSYSKKEQKINKSKSQIINPKDIYRLQIQSVLCEEIQIDKIQQNEARMRRIKRRHKHLLKFDKDYYSNLNQNQLLLL